MGIKKKILNTYEAIVSTLVVKPKAVIYLAKHKDLFKADSYFPEKKAHPTWKNFLIQLDQICRFGAYEEYYFMYGYDVKDKKERDEYLNYRKFMQRRDFLNYEVNYHNVSCILRDKLFFDIFAKALGIQTPSIVAFYADGKLHSTDRHFTDITFEELAAIKDRSLFCKETNGQCGYGIFKLDIKGGKMFIGNEQVTGTELENRISGSSYLFQEMVCQHEKMSDLYSGSINTIRLITIRSLTDNRIKVYPSILRIGANGSFVDNTSQGGIAVGFNLETGQLNEYGFHKPQFGRRVKTHPNSGIKFSEFTIPFIKEAEEQAIYFHSMLTGLQSVGWDIAIGPDGPIFIEGNDNWEINGPQVGNHGMAAEIKEAFKI